MRGRCSLAAFLLAVCGVSDVSGFEDFKAWLVERGAVFGAGGLRVGEDPATGLRGLLAGEAVANGTLIFELPAELVLTADVARQQGVAWQRCPLTGDDASSSSGSGSCSASDGSSALMSPTHTALALFLLEQRALGAPWQPWVASLPESFQQGFPLHYSQEELAVFQASPVRTVVELDQDAVAQDFATIVGTRSNLTLAEFQWARLAVKSRVFGLKSLSGGALDHEVIAMVPLADFVNHPPDGIMEENVAPSYDPRAGTFRLTAVRSIPRGEGLYWDYGFKSNRHSLLRYGFVSKQRVALTDMPLFLRLSEFPGPPGTAKSLKLGLIARARKEGQLAANDDGTVLHEFSLSLAGPAAERLLGHLRFMVLQPKEAKALEELCPGTFCRPVSLANERQALRHLASLLEKLLAEYGSTAADDRELVEGGSLSPKDGAAWQALVVRYGEKSILGGFLRLLQAVDQLFDLSPWALAAAVAERWNLTDSDIHRYVQQTLTALLESEALRWAKKKVKESRAKTS